jgi:hypothetical protein
MDIHIIEAFWRDKEMGEFSGRFTAKPAWSMFADMWCWENGAADIGVILGTADGKDGLVEHLRRFRETGGPALLVLGAHGLDRTPKQFGYRLQLPDEEGNIVKIGWPELAGMLRNVVGSPAEKAVFFDSCAFCHDAKEVKGFMKATGFGLVAGYRESVQPFDSLLFEIAFVNWLLDAWRDPEGRDFPSGFLRQKGTPYNPAFKKAYAGLAKYLTFRFWMQGPSGDNPVEMTDRLYP